MLHLDIRLAVEYQERIGRGSNDLMNDSHQPLRERFRSPSPPNVFVGGPDRIYLDSRLKHAGMTDFGSAIFFDAASYGNELRTVQTVGKHRSWFD
jgi:hypothetical protein